ncbi:MAG: amino acid adenylation domain-containing protein, partial [Neisseriaceae bacterium]
MSQNRLADIPLLSEEDYIKVTKIWNDLEEAYPEDKTLHGLFEEQAAKNPNNVAIIDPNGLEYSYGYLVRDVSLLASYLCGSRGKLVGILSEKGYNQAVAALAIMKSGHGYLPLNIEWPLNRVFEVLEVGEVNTLLISKKQSEDSYYNIELLCNKYDLIIIEDILEILKNDSNLSIKLDLTNLPRVKATDIAYVIFTSGSTGKPKGVTISHQGAINTIYAINQEFKVNSTDKVLALSRLSFDLSVYDIFGLVHVGGTVIFPDHMSIKDSKYWLDLVNKHDITIWNTVPQLAELLIDASEYNKVSVNSLRLFLLSGDWIPLKLPDRIKSYACNSEIVSLGGATEGSIWSVWYKIKKVQSWWSSIPYGTAMPNQKLFILNQFLQVCPIGIVGDIYIGGVGVALNYWNDKERTNASFVEHPVLGRLYKTGDLGRWNANGYIEFMGRNDFQVKINGYRIELGEIESALSQCMDVKQSVVLAKDHVNKDGNVIGDKYIVGYYVADKKLDHEILLEELSNKLPGYMVPSVLVYLDKLPLTINGKLDSKALPNPGFVSADEYVAPRNELEQKVVSIYAEVLGLSGNKIGIEDDFFRLGGNSLHAIRLSSRISLQINNKISAADIFEKRTIRKLLDYIKVSPQEVLQPEVTHPPIFDETITFNASIPETRLWHVEQIASPLRSAYSVPIIFELNDVIDIDIDKFKHAISKLVKRHEAFRSRFVINKYNNLLKVIDKEIEFKYIEAKIDLKREFYKKLQVDICLKFDLSKSVFRLYHYIIEKENLQYVVINLHHIVCDGISQEVIARDLTHFYNQPDHDINLIYPITLFGSDISKYYNHYNFSNHTYMQQLDFWLKELKGIKPLNLYKDHSLKNNDDPFAGDNFTFNLGLKLSNRLRCIARESMVSLNTILMSGFMLVLSRFANQNDVMAATSMSNRNHTDFNNLVGYFVSTWPIRIDFSKINNLSDLFALLSEKIIDAFKNQYIYLENVIEKLNINDNQQHSLIQILFNTQSFETNIPIDTPFKLITDLSFYKMSKFDLDVTIDDSKSDLSGLVNFSTELFKLETIKTFINSYLFILEQFTNETLLLKDIQTVSWKHYKPILNFSPHQNNLNITTVDDIMQQQGKVNLPQKYISSCIHEVFIDQALSHPSYIAILDNENRITYQELYIYSNKLAHYLKKLGVQPSTLVGVILDKGWQQVVACLAIMQAGAAYLPADTQWPQSRIIEVMQQGKCNIVIGNSLIQKLKLSLKINFDHLIDINDTKLWGNECSTHLTRQQSQDDLAYVLFTSGSTGKPKGAMLHHRGVINSLVDLTHTYQFTSDTITISTASLTFDLSVFEMFSTLMVGGTIVFPDKDLQNEPLHILELTYKQKVNTWFSVPAKMSMLVETLPIIEEKKAKSIKDNFKCILLSGDVFPLSLAKKMLHLFRNASVINSGGATEVSVISLWYKIDNIEEGWHSLPYGYAMANQKLYVLDENLNYVPIGVPGDLYIGGVGVGNGYWGDEARTKAQFIYHPRLKQIIYKTGDIVRWSREGYIEYICRADFQAKINGYRIELEEIEYNISQIENISANTVLAINGQLVSFVEIDGNKNVEIKKIIKDSLQEKLPSYMIPHVVIALDQLPRSLNGKIDRLKLQKVGIEKLATSKADNINTKLSVPVNKVEEFIFNIWQEVFANTKVDYHSDFYSIGGHSLKAAQIVARIKHKLGVECLIKNIINNPTIPEQSNYIINIMFEQVKNRASNSSGVPTSNSSEVINYPLNNKNYPLSYQQRSLIFIDKIEKNNPYMIPMLFKLSPNINMEFLKLSLVALLKHHEILRTLICNDSKGNSYQEVLEFDINKLYFITVSLNNYEDIKKYITKECNYNFNFDNEYPIRFTAVLDKETQTNYLIILVHHIAFDGWSTEVMLKNIQVYYDSYASGINVEYIDNVALQYKDFALWQNKYLSNQDNYSKDSQYWNNKLFCYETTSLPVDHQRKGIFDYIGSDLSIIIDYDVSQSLRKLSNQMGVSLYTILLSGFILTVRSFNNQDDIIVGTPFSNRTSIEYEQLIGFFVNTLPLRFKINESDSLITLIKSVQNEVVETHEHQQFPFEMIVKNLNLPPDLSQNPIFQLLFSLQSFGSDTTSQSSSIMSICDLKQNFGRALFDLSVILDDSNDKITGIMNYASSLFNQSTIESFANTYLTLLKQISQLAKNNTKLISVKELTLLNSELYKKIIYDWNDTNREYPSNITIESLFAKQVLKTPDKIAVVYKNRQLTYQKLNQKANQLASYIRTLQQINPDNLIALCLDRSDYMLISTLAILKSGSAYVPIDPNYPDDRISYILEDTKTELILTNELYCDKLLSLIKVKSLMVNVISIDNDSLLAHLNDLPDINLTTNTNSNNLAYVIYTSGSTGKPKGVMIEHRNVVSLVKNVDYVKISANDCILQLASIAFDATTFEIWGSLLNGAKIYCPSDALKLVSDLELFEKVLIEHNVSILWLTKILFDQLYLQDNTIFSSLKYLLIGGEALNYNIVYDLVHSNYKPQHLINGYGPTENTTFSCTFEISSKNLQNIRSVPIGNPLNNRYAYILDSNLKPLPIGAIGELYVGGAGIARGYLNQPDLTKKRFILNPFQTDEEKVQGKNGRLYKTGDLVRWLTDGNLEYIGRNDFQVKVRGFRIELCEIESVLSHCMDIKQAVVLAQDRVDKDGNVIGDKYIVGYYVADKKLDHEILLKELSSKLPEYMVPSVLVYLDKLPLTINGKLDSKVLPEPKFTNVEEYIAPKNELETTVCEIFAQVLCLSVQKISIQDSFFRLGGNSILSIELVRKINLRYNTNISISEVIILKTVEAIANKINTKINKPQIIIKLNRTSNKPNLFMIHAGHAGAEAYVKLAERFENIFSCYGIDSYNLYAEDN